MELGKALQLSRERGLDLMQVTEKVDPPVCKIIDYGKYLYREEKKKRQTKKQTKGGLKGIRLSFNISVHDLEIRAKSAEKFLKKGNKVRIEMRLKGREKALQSFAREKMNKFLEMLKNLLEIKVERDLKKEVRGLTIIISKK